jgi:GntR family transcriptional regulator, transcriptional repressor for pyruvate dehydrogenase complex
VTSERLPADGSLTRADEAVFRPVREGNAFEETVERLLQAIKLGVVVPGERLPAERELAEQLGVARISLREAIRQLREDGYVEVRRGASGGTYVTELRRPAEAWRARMREQVGEMDDILDFRIALETETAVLAARRHTKSSLVPVRDAVDALHDVIGRTAFRQADSRFHVALARAARNERLEEAIESARSELFSPRDLLPFREPVEETLRDHRAVYDAVRAGDAEGAAEAMRAHLERSRRQLRTIVFGADDDAEWPTG